MMGKGARRRRVIVAAAAITIVGGVIVPVEVGTEGGESRFLSEWAGNGRLVRALAPGEVSLQSARSRAP